MLFLFLLGVGGALKGRLEGVSYLEDALVGILAGALVGVLVGVLVAVSVGVLVGLFVSVSAGLLWSSSRLEGGRGSPAVHLPFVL